MLFDSSLRKELGRSFGATLVVLVTVVMTMMLIRTLGQASRGSVAPADVLLVMGYTVLGQLPTILSLSLLIAVVSSLSRMYRDSEMVIWFACGQGLLRLLPPLLRFAWPVMLSVAALSLAVWPWANRQVQELKVRYEQRSDVDRVAPGQFQESANGMRVFFVDKDTSKNTTELPSTEADPAAAPPPSTSTNVFIATTEADRETVTSARSARIQVDGGERVGLLRHGQRLEVLLTQEAGLRLSEFEEYGIQIGSSAPKSQTEGAIKTRDTLALLASDQTAERAELGWRIGLALAVLNFVILGLALAIVNPRAGRSASLMLAIFAFMAYYNLMTVGQSWVAAGRLGLLPFMLGLHGGTLLLGLGLLLARHHQWSPRWRRPRMSAPPLVDTTSAGVQT